MTRASIVAAAALLAGCATPAAYDELKGAQVVVKQHDSAKFYSKTQLLDGSSGQQHQAALRMADRCHADFGASVLKAKDVASRLPLADALAFVANEANQVDATFDQCLRQYGLTGHMEFKLGDQFLPTPTFVQSYFKAWERFTKAQAKVNTEAHQNGVALAIGVGAAAQAAAMYQPPPAPRPVVCTSSQGLGRQLITTCQ